MKQTCPGAMVLSAPVLMSLAFSGNFAQTCAYSETCRYCRVLDRMEVETRMLELLAKISSSAESFTIGRAELLWQHVVRELNFVAEDHTRIIETVSNGARANVRIEQASVEHEELKEGSES
jgi:hypothetical protein